MVDLKGMFKGQLRSVIEWENSSPEELFSLWSANGDEIKNASKLIVKPGQGVIFLYEGKIEAVHLQEGLYELRTANIPFVTTVIKFMQAFESEHKVGIYYFWQTQFLNLKWGSTSPIKYEDPVYKFPVALLARGNFSFKITDARRFFTQVVGSRDSYKVNDARVVIVDRLQQLLVPLLAESGYSYADIDKHRDDLGKQLLVQVAPELIPFGFELIDFRIEATDFDEDTNRRIARIADLTAESEALRRAGISYAESQRLEALREAARNEGGISGLGVGIGAGIGLGGQMAQAFGGTPAPSQQSTGSIVAESSDPAVRLQKLKALFDSGLISKEEFDKKKEAILNEI